MIVKPKIKNHFCITAHPLGCAANVDEQIAAAKNAGFIKPLKNVLVIGCSTGYGLSSRIVSSFAAGASTIGVMHERVPKPNRTGSAGWYNNRQFEERASDAGFNCHTINGDAFSQSTKDEVIEEIKNRFGQLDLVVYSLAAPRRQDPKTGDTWQSVLKPIGSEFRGYTANPNTEELKEISLVPANEQEIQDTIKVMGGEDWHDWISQLYSNNLLAHNFRTISYSYIGSEVTWPIYGNATIGRAKSNLIDYAEKINESFKSIDGRAHVGVLKATITQSSSAIPVFPLYISMLLPIMKSERTHETDLEQIARLFSKHLLLDDPDASLLLRTDDLELSPSTQAQIISRWKQLSSSNASTLCDFGDYRREFLSLFGFGKPSIDYEKDIDPMTGAYINEKTDSPRLEQAETA